MKALQKRQVNLAPLERELEQTVPSWTAHDSEESLLPSLLLESTPSTSTHIPSLEFDVLS